MLSIRDLPVRGLAPVSLDLGAGECLAVMGPSGAGKSLLLRAVADLDPPCPDLPNPNLKSNPGRQGRGRVTLDGEPREHRPAPLWRRLVTYVAADSGWWADRVGEHIPGSPATIARLEAVGLAAGALDWPVSRLSNGERQRLALVRALVQEPRVLLLDEPTSALDEATTLVVEQALRRCLAAGMALLMVTHDAAQAGRLARRLLRVDGGCVREEAVV